MNIWLDKTSEISPPLGRVLIAYCPNWCPSEYEIVKWDGYNFECDSHGTEISSDVEKWCLFMEAD